MFFNFLLKMKYTARCKISKVWGKDIGLFALSPVFGCGLMTDLTDIYSEE